MRFLMGELIVTQIISPMKANTFSVENPTHYYGLLLFALPPSTGNATQASVSLPLHFLSPLFAFFLRLPLFTHQLVMYHEVHVVNHGSNMSLLPLYMSHSCSHSIVQMMPSSHGHHGICAGKFHTCALHVITNYIQIYIFTHVFILF